MNKKGLQIAVVLIMLTITLILFSLIFLNLNSEQLLLGNVIRGQISGGVTGVNAEIDARGPYSTSENFILIAFGVLILAGAYFLMKKANKTHKIKLSSKNH